MKQLVVIGSLLVGCSNAGPVADLTAGKVVESSDVGARPQRALAYDRLVRGLASCRLEAYQIDQMCPGLQAFTASLKEASLDDRLVLAKKLLAHASPAVRVESAELLRGVATFASQDAIAEAGAREHDPNVREALIRAVANDGAKNPRVAMLLLGAADDPTADVRMQAILAISANRGMPGGAEKLAAIAQSDPDPKLRRTACEYAGKLGSSALLPLYEKATASAEDPELYAACMQGLVSMFHDHPAFETANEDAYRLFLRRLDAKPRTEHTPPWNVMSAFCYFSHDSDPDKLAAWKQRAPWFDAGAVKQAMTSVIADKASSWMARVAAVESMVGLGATKQELEALKQGYSTADRNDRQVLDKIDSVLAE